MKNLKRVLSLGLASVMLLGMMVVGASAKDFTDAEDITHGEAVQTLVALNVIKGKEDGSYFDPKGTVTRAEMAKMIAVVMNGGNEDATGVKMTPSFTDISDNWAQPYIEYCYDMGIISGRGDGTFDPNGNVTGLEVAKMVLTAMGYDAEAYQLTGASWAVRTNEVARTAQPRGLYEDLIGVAMNGDATRDTAAQLIWNGLQSYVSVITPTTDKASTGLEWGYAVDKTTTLLKQRYGANIWYGTYAGNGDSMSSVDDGCIYIDNAGFDTTAVGSRNSTAWFPSDLSVDNMGEEVKVIYKDINGGIPGKPDKRDIIYGAFNTGSTVVYRTTKDALQSVTNASKVKFGGAEYDTVGTSITVVTNYIGTGTATSVNGTIKDTTRGSGWRDLQLLDQIKFVCDNDTGKIAKAYVTTINAARVTAVSASKVTLSGVGSIDIDDNNIYEDIAKDDVVFYTKFYDTDKDKATFTLTKAEEVEGELTGWKVDGTAATSPLVDVAVDGEVYKVAGKPQANVGINNGNALTDDAVVKLVNTGATSDAAIGDTVRLYLANGMVVAVEALEQSGGKYALIVDSDGTSSPNTIGGTGINPFRVTVLLPDGTKETLKIHKDSKLNGSASSVVAGSATATSVINTNLGIGGLVEYTSITDGSIKLKNVIAANSPTSIAGETYGVGAGSIPQAANSSTPTKVKVWDEDTKILTYDFNASGVGTASAVAAADAVLFVAVNNSNALPTSVNDKTYAYNLRDLGDLYLTNADTTGSAAARVAVFKNSDGLVKAAFVILAGKPGSATENTRYGIVSKYVGTREIDSDTYYRYEVAVDEDTTIEVAVDVDNHIKKGDVVKFEERNDQKYEAANILKFGTAPVADGTATMGTPIAVKEYKAEQGILVAFNGTNRASRNSGYVGTGSPVTYTVSKDVKIVYINADGQKAGEETGVVAFAADTGYANAIVHKDDKGVVDVILVETSNKKNILRNETLNSFASKTEYTMAAATGTGKQTNTNVTVAVTPSETDATKKIENGTTVSYTVNLTTASGDVASVATSKIIKVTFAGMASLDKVESSLSNCSAVIDGNDLKITITTAITAVTGTITVTGTISGNTSATVAEA